MQRRNLYLLFAVVLVLIGAAIVTSLYVQAGRQITSFEEARPLPGAVLYDQDGEVIKRLGTGSVYVPLDQTPQDLQNAVKSTQKSKAINQRLARQILEPQGLWARLQLAILPSVLERRYSKRERLEIYLNNAYFGEGAYGVEAASQTYFATPVKNIDLAQSALLAALAQEPESASPFSNANRAREQRNAVLAQMQQAGHIDRNQQEQAAQEAIDANRHAPGYAHHFSDYLGNLLIEELGEERVYQGGLRVTTTLNRELQKFAESMFQDAKLDGALVALDPTSGAILAMVGGRNYLEDSTNMATVKRQEVGTTLRPLIYATGLQEEWAVNHLVEDIQRDFGDFKVDNADDRYWGPVTMKHALVMDLNNAAAWTLNELGLDRFNEFAQSVNLNIAQVDQHLRLVMGEVREGLSLLQLAAAYLPGVSGGNYAQVSAIEQVTDTQNQKVLTDQTGTPKRILSKEQAYLFTDMLLPGTQYGSIRALDMDFPAALTASSSPNDNSQWAIGYTPELLVGVLVNPQSDSEDETPAELVAGDLWVRFMANALAQSEQKGQKVKAEDENTTDNDSEKFEVPDDVETNVLIDVFTGLLASERCPQVERDAFIKGTKPTELAPCALPPPEPPPRPVAPLPSGPIVPEPIEPEPEPEPEPQPEPEPEPQPEPEPEPIEPEPGPIEPTEPATPERPPAGPPGEETPPVEEPIVPEPPQEPVQPTPPEE